MASPDKDWEAEGDADTLIRAQEILNDEKRVKRAKTILKKRSDAAQNAEAQLEKKTTDRIKKYKSK